MVCASPLETRAGDDLLEGEAPVKIEAPAPKVQKPTEAGGADPHAALYDAEKYPSATQCAACHRAIYNT